MDEEQIKALIKGALEEHGKTLLTQVDQKNAGLAASITKELKKSLESLQPAPQPEAEQPSPKPGTGDGEANGGNASDTGKLTLKALQSQLLEQTKLIQQLKEEGERKERETFVANRKSALASAIAEAKTLNPALLQKVLEVEYGDNLKSENGGWFVQQGDSVKGLKDALSGYLQTDEGKAFLPASGTQGSGSTESKTTTPPPAGTTVKAVELLDQAFSSF